MLKYASTMVAAVTLGMVTVFAQPAYAQTTEKPLVLKGQSTHPASSNFHLIFKLWAETVEANRRRQGRSQRMPEGSCAKPSGHFRDANDRSRSGVPM